MDSIYDMTNVEEACITSSFPDSLPDYALSSIGIKLFRATRHTGIFSTYGNSLLITKLTEIE
jgi:hypothetical protein